MIKPENAAVVLGQLQAIDDKGGLNARQVEPFMLRSLKQPLKSNRNIL